MDFPDLGAAARDPGKRGASAAELEKRALRAALLKYMGGHVQPFRRRRLPAQTPRSCSSARSMVALPEPSLGGSCTAALRAPAPPTPALSCPAHRSGRGGSQRGGAGRAALLRGHPQDRGRRAGALPAVRATPPPTSAHARVLSWRAAAGVPWVAFWHAYSPSPCPAAPSPRPRPLFTPVARLTDASPFPPPCSCILPCPPFQLGAGQLRRHPRAGCVRDGGRSGGRVPQLWRCRQGGMECALECGVTCCAGRGIPPAFGARPVLTPNAPSSCRR